MADKNGDAASSPQEAKILIGIGASAGGLEPLQAILRAVPPESGIPIIVVSHMDRSAKTLLTDALQPKTRLTVVEATDGAEITGATVYIVPGHSRCSVVDYKIALTPIGSSENRSHPIDDLLHSLAQVKQTHAVGIILSGNGSDGALGLKAVSDAGGMTIAQDPDTAQNASMPQSAIDTGAVDHVLAPSHIADEILAYAKNLKELIEDEDQRLNREIAEVLPEVCDHLLETTGHNFRHYKTTTLVRRLQRRIQVLRLRGAQEYVSYLRGHDNESEILFKELLINVTAFFRDTNAFEALSSKVIPALFEQHGTEPIRIWVAGCSTGEEAYSIAMLVREQLDVAAVPRNVQIFATDIDDHALGIARQGTYPLGIADELSAERLRRFFVKKGQQYQVTKEIRELCLFSAHNLINDPPFSRLDLISCRNVLIYLGSHLQKKLVPLFHYALRSGGFLFLGPSESIDSHRELFRPLDLKHRISQRLPTTIRRGGLVSTSSAGPASAKPPNVPSASELDTYLLMQRIILDELSPKAVVVDEEGQIVCASGNLEKYLTLSAGAFHNNIIRLAREGLRVGVRAGLAEAARIRRKVVNDKLSLHTDDGIQRVMLVIQPMPQMGEDSGLFFIAFQDVGTPILRGESSEESSAAGDRQLVEQLERELLTTREDLEKTVHDLEAANQDLKSSNEELLSMNEELQSANEELETSKEEVQAANEQLSGLNTDLENLLASTQIATIFLDEHGSIRRLTPAANEIFNIRVSDAGRPLTDLTHRAREMPPIRSLQQGTGAGQRELDEIEMTDGRWFLRRVLPYLSREGVAEGVVVTFTDITERKRSEAELRASEERYRAIGEAIDYGVWMCDADGTNTYASESFLKLVGLTQEQCAGEGWTEVLHPEDRERTAAAWKQCAREGQLWDIEHRVRGVDGEWHPILARGVPIRDADSNIVCWVGINLDISRQKKVERMLRASEERFRRMADSAPVFIWTTGIDCLKSWFNKPFMQFAGLPLDKLLGSGFLELIHADDLPMYMAKVAQSMESEDEYTIEYRAKRHDGEFRWLLESGVPLRGPQQELEGFISSAKDIHDRKLAAQAVVEINAKLEYRLRELHALYDLAPVGINVAEDSECRRISSNRALADMLGMPYGANVSKTADDGTKITYQVLKDGKEIPVSDLPMQRAARHGARVRDELLEFVRADGSRLEVLVNADPLRDERGELKGAVGVCVDVTRMRQIENALKEADQRKDEFLAMLAHELRNPLAAISNAAEVQSRVSDDKQTLGWATQVIIRQSRQLARLVDDLTDVSRINRGKIQLKQERLDLTAIVRTAIEVVRSALERKRQFLQVNLPAGEVPVTGDSSRVEQILVNILNNAVKYTDEEGRIVVSLDIFNDDAFVAVEDTGIGIAPEVLPSVFDLFAQAEVSLDRSQGGLGIGLTLVRMLAEMHGGSIKAHSDGLGKGSTFTLRLPLSAQPAVTPAKETRRRMDRAKKLRILVVDDNVDGANGIARLLRELGHEVRVAIDGPGALAVTEAFRPEAILLDIGLPGMSGYEVAESLRADTRFSEVKMIALSGYGQIRDMERSKLAGFDHHILKPVEFEKLLELLPA